MIDVILLLAILVYLGIGLRLVVVEIKIWNRSEYREDVEWWKAVGNVVFIFLTMLGGWPIVRIFDWYVDRKQNSTE